MRRFTLVVVVVAALAFAACTVPPPSAPSQLADRQTDPVVLTGAEVPALSGAAVGDVVGFRYLNGGWAQFPVQVDERKTVELNTVYNKPANTTNPVFVNVYADPNTFTGPDNGVVDNDDEIAFMAADSGNAAPSGSEPQGVVHASGARVTVTDPLDSATTYAYLFRRSDPSLSQGAGKRYVVYAFNLTSGDYKATYNLSAGPNPETSWVTTSFYRRGFHDRWLDDEMSVSAGGASNADIVDRHKEMFAPGQCGRTEDTFDSGEGAFIANINGPVRAIRSFIGANSGPYTERTQIFYAQREDIVTDLRVHSIPSVMDVFDYSDAARGMTYSNQSTTGVTIDGKPDAVGSTRPVWEKIDGAPGAVTHVSSFSTDINPAPTVTQYYEDNDTNPTTQCTGDTAALGTSGPYVTSAIPNTDPHNGPANALQARRSIFYEAPGRSAADAQRHANQVASPLTVQSTQWP